MKKILSSVKVYKIEPVLGLQDVLLHLLVDDLPAFYEICSCTKGRILVVVVDAAK